MFEKMIKKNKEIKKENPNRKFIESFFKNLRVLKTDSKLSQEVISEIVELRQNYYKMYRFLIKIMPLAQVAIQDINQSKNNDA